MVGVCMCACSPKCLWNEEGIFSKAIRMFVQAI